MEVAPFCVVGSPAVFAYYTQFMLVADGLSTSLRHLATSAYIILAWVQMMDCAKHRPVFGRAVDLRIFAQESLPDGRTIKYRDGSGITMPLPAQLRACLTEHTVLTIARRTR